MSNPSPVSRKIYLTILSILGWFALAGQLGIILANRTKPVFLAILLFLSYFTILTNFLVALCSTVLLVNRKSRMLTFFSNPKVLTAIAMYITIVGLVYNTILRFQWQPKGLQLIVDELLHSVVPVLFIVFWFVFVPKAYLKAKDIFPWLLYPLFYIIYVLIRGSINGVYPYPFIDVKALGYGKVFFNSGMLVIVFVIFSLFYVGLDKFLKKQN